MAWRVGVAGSAGKQLRRAPARDAERLVSALQDLAEMPFSGHVEKMRGFESKYRRRVGDWRIVFDVYSAERLVRVTAIERRTTTTYRRS